MAQLKVVVDGKTILDGDPKYVGKPPEELAPDKIRAAGKKLKPSQVALATVFSIYAMQGQVTGAVNFDFAQEDWTLTVKNIDGVRHIDIVTG
ncbi:hypothetical protein [Mycolicibacterium llatzerense]|uniref:hypothetical protein n=1 Tax=Mycolicibacterium llatzerense TaxID=280871 RepID=UPI0021B651C9|nr:hypothetical protein [Mycolicibacterium llatzerense]MCT7366491.1 hypothetical protein [Mycolicibacterium llatzerense]